MAVVSTSNCSSNKTALLRYSSPTVQSHLLSAPSFVLRSTTQVEETPFLELLKSFQATYCIYTTIAVLIKHWKYSHIHLSNHTEKISVITLISSRLVATRKETKPSKRKQTIFDSSFNQSLFLPKHFFSRPSSTSLIHFTCRGHEFSSSVHFLQNVKF